MAFRVFFSLLYSFRGLAYCPPAIQLFRRSLPLVPEEYLGASAGARSSLLQSMGMSMSSSMWGCVPLPEVATFLLSFRTPVFNLHYNLQRFRDVRGNLSTARFLTLAPATEYACDSSSASCSDVTPVNIAKGRDNSRRTCTYNHVPGSDDPCMNARLGVERSGSFAITT
jgi:hypothetical protein